MEKMKI